MSGVEIEIRALAKRWGETTAVDGISFTAEAGRFTVLLGPSGCGKSTTLRLIAGLEEASGGRILIDGRDVTRAPPDKRQIAMVFQSYALFPHLNVAENILFGLKVRKVPAAERARRLERVAALLGLSQLLERKPSQLSGGQQQRVALGRAIIAEKPICLMDEPLSNLDAKLRHEMRSELSALHRRTGRSFVYVTHDQAEALTMSTRMAVMMEGNILQLGSPDEIYHNPQDRRVAEFIGSPKMNMLDGEADGNGNVVVHGVPLRRRVAPGKRAIKIGIRPEHLRIVNDGSPNAVWPFTLSHKENLGSDFYLHGQMNGVGTRVVARATPAEASSIPIGGQTLLAAAEGAAMAFGTDNQRLSLIEA